jgi:DNA-binding protein HU-beta
LNKKTKNTRKKHKKNIDRVKALKKKSLAMAKSKPKVASTSIKTPAKKAPAKKAPAKKAPAKKAPAKK